MDNWEPTDFLNRLVRTQASGQAGAEVYLCRTGRSMKTCELALSHKVVGEKSPYYSLTDVQEARHSIRCNQATVTTDVNGRCDLERSAEQ
jgi:hypothetical protein